MEGDPRVAKVKQGWEERGWAKGRTAGRASQPPKCIRKPCRRPTLYKLIKLQLEESEWRCPV